MVALYPYTLNYDGRQVDIELLQSVLKPVDLVRVNLALSFSEPKIVTGIQKVAQRYTLLLLSVLGEIEFDRVQGSLLLVQLNNGWVQDKGQLQIAFANANSRTVAQMQADDTQSAVYGTMQPDEQIADAKLLDFDIDFQSASVYLRTHIITRAGTGLTYVVPVTAAR